MTLKQQQVVSAQVILKSMSGKSPGARGAITAQNIRDFVPTAEIIERVRGFFRMAGFEAGPVVGNSFSITGLARTFESIFKTRLRRQERGGIKSIRNDGSGSYELPLQGLPQGVAELVEAVTFTPPPDFGPTNFGP
jgi:hypothetical protein